VCVGLVDLVFVLYGAKGGIRGFSQGWDCGGGSAIEDVLGIDREVDSRSSLRYVSLHTDTLIDPHDLVLVVDVAGCCYDAAVDEPRHYPMHLLVVAHDVVDPDTWAEVEEDKQLLTQHVGHTIRLDDDVVVAVVAVEARPAWILHKRSVVRS
jgi:hypothetical protein